MISFLLCTMKNRSLILCVYFTVLWATKVTLAAFRYDEPAEVCTTPGCVKAAAYLLEAIDLKNDPCNNFFEYACGQWKQDNPIPDDLSTYSSFTRVRESVTKQIKMLLEKEVACESKAITMAKKIYASCMDIESLSKTKSEPLIGVLMMFGGWPLLDPKWNGDKMDFTEFLGKIRKDYGLDLFVDLDVSADFKNVSNTMLSIDQGTLGLGSGTRNYYLNDTLYAKQMAAYKQLMMDTVQLLTEDLGIPMTNQMKDDIEKMISFEKQLANITVPEENRRNISLLYNKWHVPNISTITPFVDWSRYFKTLMPSEVFEFANKPEFWVNVAEPPYMQRLQNLLKQTEKKTLVNYIFWRLVKSWSSILDVRYEDISQTFMKTMYGREEKPVRWKRCVPAASNLMEMAIGSLYVKEHFKKDDKAEAVAMIKNIQSAFKGIVNDLDWMDLETKKIANEKADAMLPHIGYPDFILNDTALDDYYLKLDITKDDNYFNIIKKLTIYHQNDDLEELLKPFDRFKFVGGPADVNAYYTPERNAIIFPSGILQPPFFKGDFPKYINYGAIGAVIGHEITHGFDDQGSQFDSIGNLEDWWSASAAEHFKQKTECIIEQYGNYTVPEINAKVNGKLTQGENIADNGGIKQAFKAYKKYLKDLGREEARLPGLQTLTNEQVFFLSFANFWCGQAKPGFAVSQILTDPHSPYMFRVIGTLTNFEEFSKAFNCPKGSTMNPDPEQQPRCTVW